jgi:anti-sigma factor RsiW
VSGHTCPERLLLPEALSGRLEPAEEKRVMAHLPTCAACEDAAADIEIALVSLAVLRDADEQFLPELVPSGPLRSVEPATAETTASAPVPLRSRRPVRRGLLVAAAAVALVGGGVAAGHALLPPRDSVHYGPALAISPPAGAADLAASGTVAVGVEDNALAVRLKAHSLPATGWYECVWVAGGQSRSAGSFRAAGDGTVNVELKVAPAATPGGWDLQVIRHVGSSSQVVLEGSASDRA